jgi:hypothetical protein
VRPRTHFMFMGARHPKEWFEAYVSQGAPAEFVQYPPLGEDGHGLFTRFPEVWIPKVVEFLQAQGFNSVNRPWLRASKDKG